MVGSLDSLDFCTDITENGNSAFPLHCWQTFSLADIWIPSQLLTNRNKSCKTEDTGISYHTLQKKDASKYSESFSVYIDASIKNEQEDIFLSDSDEEILNTSMNVQEIKRLSDNLSANSDDIPTNSSKAFNLNKEDYFKNKNAVFRKNYDNAYSDLKASSVDNLCNFDEQKIANTLYLEKDSDKSCRSLGEENNIFIQNVEKIDYSKNQSNSASKNVFLEQIKYFNSMHSLEKVNKDSDSHISLNEILNDAPVTSLKDFESNFGIRKKEKHLDSYNISDKQKSNSKKARKDKKGKKLEKCLPFQSLFEDMDTTQEFNCNRYMNAVLQERERYARFGDNLLVSKEEYPDLTPEELVFIHSDNTMKEANVKRGKFVEIDDNSLRSKKYLDSTSDELSFYHSDNTREEENIKRERYGEIDDNSLHSKKYLDLTSDELAFYHSDSKVKEENVQFTPTFSFSHSDQATKRNILSNEEILKDATVENAEFEETDDFLQKGKIVIENIPPDVSEDDICLILSGYGEITNFSMISSGKSLKVLVEINLICDVDWVIECLNGSEPFGTSTGVLKCYLQTE